MVAAVSVAVVSSQSEDFSVAIRRWAHLGAVRGHRRQINGECGTFAMRLRSAKIVGSRCAEGIVGQGIDESGLDYGRVSRVLNFALDGEEGFLGNSEPPPFEESRVDNNVGNASFVFEAYEDKSLSSSWSLAANDHSGDMNMLSISALRQIARQGYVRKSLANEGHGMTSRGNAGAGKIGLESFKGIHGSKGPRCCPRQQ